MAPHTRPLSLCLRFLLLPAISGQLLFADQAAAPTFSPAPGTYPGDIDVRLACATPGALIRYTTDGTAPTGSSPLYDGTPVRVTRHASVNHDPDPLSDPAPVTATSAAIRAQAFAQGMDDSAVAAGDYVVDRIESWFDIPYAPPPPEGGSAHWLDVYSPRGARNNKVLLFIYGGAWKQGDKNLYFEMANTFAGYYGLTTVVANYELSKAPYWAVFPDHILDVAAAFDWVKRNIERYGGDPRKVFLFGQSAGGHLVSLLATDGSYLADPHGWSPDDIRGVVSMSGAYALNDMVHWPNNPLGLTLTEVQEYQLLCQLVFGSDNEAFLAGFSPQTHISEGQPPLHTLYCWDDMPGFPEGDQRFFQAVTLLGGPYVDIQEILASDIPPEVLAMSFGTTYDGHYQEMYAINTGSYDCLPARTVVDFLNLPLHYDYDVNGDGTVGRADSAALASGLAECGPLPHGDSSADVNLDSRADALDLVILELQLAPARPAGPANRPQGLRRPPETAKRREEPPAGK